MFSGLGAGQMRSLEALQAAVKSNGTTPQELPDRLSTVEPANNAQLGVKPTEAQQTAKDLPDKL
jgi:hypothetical protein